MFLVVFMSRINEIARYMKRHNTGIRGWLLAVIACGMVSLPSALMAQEDTGNESFLSTTSTSTTSTAMVTALGVLTVVTITPKPRNRAFKQYLEHNAVAVQDGITLGGGEAVADMASAFGIRDHAELEAFGQVLRGKQEVLVGIVEDHQVSDEELMLFIHTVYEGMLAQSELEAAAKSLEG